MIKVQKLRDSYVLKLAKYDNYEVVDLEIQDIEIFQVQSPESSFGFFDEIISKAGRAGQKTYI